MLFSACNSDGSEAPGHITRIDIAMADGEVPDCLGSLYSVMADSGQSYDDWVKAYASSPAMQVFGPDVRERLTDLSAAENALAELRKNGYDFQGPLNYYGIVTPYRQSIVIVADTFIYIGLNHYLGADYPGYESFEPYQRVTKDVKYIAPDVAEAIVRSRRPFVAQAPTVLQRMLYEGAVIYAMHHLMPSIDETTLMGYTPEQYTWLKDNEANIWREMITQQLLYSTDPMAVTRLIEPSPATAVISPECPPRAARYIGYCIVTSFIKQNPSYGYISLLTPAFYTSDSALQQSQYQP